MDPSKEHVQKILGKMTDHEKTGMAGTRGRFDLSLLKRMLDDLSRPDREYIKVHVAGTKGKGSVSAFTASILEAHGMTAGLYSSPHLYEVTERITAGGRDITYPEMSDVFRSLERRFPPEELRRLTYFELITLAAFVYFGVRKVGAAVLETGLGGRLDATNAVDSRFCVITPVSLDHCDVLGSDTASIAREKAGIIKPGAFCVSSPQEAPALDVIEQVCRARGAELAVVGRDIRVRVNELSPAGGSFDVKSGAKVYNGLRVAMPGRFQPFNAALAIGICERVLDGRIDEASLKEGLERVFLPGRMEVLSERPVVLADGAQNAASAGELRRSVESIFSYDRLILILGMSADKDMGGVCGELVPAASEVILTRAANPRAADPSIIRGYVRGAPVTVTRDTREALGLALSKAGEKDLVVSAGSFYTAAEVRDLLLPRDKGT